MSPDSVRVPKKYIDFFKYIAYTTNVLKFMNVW